MAQGEGGIPDFDHGLFDMPTGPSQLLAADAPAAAATETPAADEQVQDETQDEAEKEEKEPSGFVHWLTNLDAYTVMLAVSFTAIVIGALCLLAEWGRYKFDTKARTFKQQSAATAPAGHAGAASTTAAA